jgi:sialic acid synthase SpsE
VFDLESLKFLLNYDIPFVKIANRRDLDWLIGEIPRKTEIYISYSECSHIICKRISNVKYMACISNYPALSEDYEKRFEAHSLKFAISDHTIGTELYKKYQPMIWEKHYKLNDSTGLDAGPFSITPEELKEIL